MRKAHPSDLTDESSAIIEPPIPVHRLGRPRDVEIGEILNTIFYQARSGCQWDMPPHDLPPESTGYADFEQWWDDGARQVILDAPRR